MAILSVVYVYLKKKQIEGFQNMGILPTSVTSMISSDTAGSTSSDPTKSVAQPKDIQATKDTFHILKLLRKEIPPSSTNLSKTDIKKIQHALSLERTIKKDLSHMTVGALSKMRHKIEEATTLLRNSKTSSSSTHNVLPPSPKPNEAKPSSTQTVLPPSPKPNVPPPSSTQTVLPPSPKPNMPPPSSTQNVLPPSPKPSVAKPSSIQNVPPPSPKPNATKPSSTQNGLPPSPKPNVTKPSSTQNGLPLPNVPQTQPTSNAISVSDLHTLKDRIQKENQRLANLRTTSPTVTARQAQLEKLGADVGDILSSVQRGTMKPSDIPIHANDATAFLQNIHTSQSSSLITPTPQTGKKSLPMEQVPVTNMPDIAALAQKAQFLKWNVHLNVEFDPAVEQREKLLSRLDSLETRLNHLTVGKKNVPNEEYKAYERELRSIHTHIGNKDNTGRRQHTQRLLPDSSRDSVTPDYPSRLQQSTAQEDGMSKFPSGRISPDEYIRPGFVMNDESIARRASASAFDPSTVGGPDYKKRSQELCRQIQGSQLGDPQTFGCIANPEEVGGMYSWKGNFEMVCNRVGDTWGGGYPEMFGCAKYDPTKKFMSM